MIRERKRAPSSTVVNFSFRKRTKKGPHHSGGNGLPVVIRFIAVALIFVLIWDLNETISTTIPPSNDVILPPHVNQAQCPSILEDPHHPRLGTKAPPFPQNGKPFFILHIGPSKTGTTSLQKDSVQLLPILEKDQYVYLGRYAPPSLRQPCRMGDLFSLATCQPPRTQAECWRERTQGIRELYHARNMSIIVSDEALSYERFWIPLCNDPHYLPALYQSLVQEWNVLVVVTYRRYGEWLLSVAKEFNDKLCHNPYRPEGWWNGSKCISLWHLVDTYRSTTVGDAFGYMNWDRTVQAWRNKGIPVQIMTLPTTTYNTTGTRATTESLTSYFYCHVVPNIPHTCRYARTNLTMSRQNTKSVMTTVYNDIVYEAAQSGLVVSLPSTIPTSSITINRTTTTKTRQEFVGDLAMYGTSVGLQMVDLPLICPRRVDLEMLLSKSLQMEHALVFSEEEETRYQYGNDTQHQHDFWKMAHEHKEFCQVDTSRLLRNKSSWEQVLQDLQGLAGKRSFGLLLQDNP